MIEALIWKPKIAPIVSKCVETFGMIGTINWKSAVTLRILLSKEINKFLVSDYYNIFIVIAKQADVLRIKMPLGQAW